jgi:UMF1 family MFS transporter
MSASRRAVAGWALFDWASQPFYTLILTFLFAPYFATGFIGDPVEGQALWGAAVGVAAALVALLSPPLGAMADAEGGRKRAIAVFSIFMVAGMSLLWLAAPGARDLTWIVLGSFVVAYVAAELATVFNNAMMPGLVAPRGLGRLSGAGWAVGYLGGLVSLVVMAGLVIENPDTGRTALGLAPLLPLDAAAREGERMVGPFSALWYLVFVLPFFLFTPDMAQRGEGSWRDGLARLAATLRGLGAYRDIAWFLAARMFYADGLA